MRVYYDRDADVNLIKGKKVAIIGYGSQGHAHANNLKDSGVDRASRSGCGRAPAAWRRPRPPGLKVMDPADCAKWADVVMVLTPDEGQGDLYREKLGPNMKSGRGAGVRARAERPLQPARSACRTSTCS